MRSTRAKQLRKYAHHLAQKVIGDITKEPHVYKMSKRAWNRLSGRARRKVANQIQTLE